MAGSFAEAQAQIRSLRPDELTAKAGQLREIGIDLRLCGSELGASADEVGSQVGRPYATYRDRVTPTATYLRELQNPTNTVAEGLDRSATAGKQAGMVLAEQEQLLAELASRPTTTPAQFAAAEAQALAVVNRAIDAVSQAYAAITPPTPAAAPVVVAGPGARDGAGLGGTTGNAAQAALGGAVLAGAGPGTSAVLGPEAGALAGFVADPLSGNLIDPASGREVDAGGRFVDPITGEPFGEPSPFATRLEGLVGGPAAGGVGLPPAGALGPAVAGPVGAGAGAVGGGGVGGAVPFPPPAGFGAAVGARGEAGRIAGLYGGAVPPSLSGRNPAIGELAQTAARNLEHRAGVAQRYAAIASGQAQPGPGFFPPPMMGVGGGGAGAARSARRGGPRAVTEPAGVWGAVPGRDDRDRTATPSADTEDDDIWTGGAPPPAAALLG
ncbi:MAG TPA: hypothetical protein VNA11_12060 [Pseudonocardia sp.]|nr:hypothetical protein [Pseudonocardia sp.]